MSYSYQPHYFEDYELGDTFESAARTITEADFVFHSSFSGDWTELHTNAEYSDEQHFDERVAHGPMTFSVATGLVFRTGLMERTAVAFIGMDYMDLPQPVFIDDTVALDMTVEEIQDVSSRDDAGMVRFDTDLTNQEGKSVLLGDMKFLVKKNG